MFSNNSEYWNWKEDHCLECAFGFDENRKSHTCKTEAFLDAGLADPKVTPQIREINGKIKCTKFKSVKQHQEDQERAKQIKEAQPLSGQIKL